MVAELEAAREKLHKAIDRAFYLATDLVYHGKPNKAASIAYCMSRIDTVPPYVTANWAYLAEKQAKRTQELLNPPPKSQWTREIYGRQCSTQQTKSQA